MPAKGVEKIWPAPGIPPGSHVHCDALDALVRLEDAARILEAIALLPDPEPFAVLEVRLGSRRVPQIAGKLSTSACAVSRLLWTASRHLEETLRSLRGSTQGGAVRSYP